MLSEKKLREKLSENEKYQKAIKLQNNITQLNEEIRVLDRILAEMQVNRIEKEVSDNSKTTPFWHRFFTVKKDYKSKEYFAETSSYNGNRISLCEPEIMFLRSFKAKRVEELMKEVAALSAEISRD